MVRQGTGAPRQGTGARGGGGGGKMWPIWSKSHEVSRCLPCTGRMSGSVAARRVAPRVCSNAEVGRQDHSSHVAVARFGSALGKGCKLPIRGVRLRHCPVKTR